jgi:tetratricopeptide (TPR) repeat protein
LAIKWIISCSKNPDHLVELIEEYRRSRPTPNNLCEFCFTFEYNSLSSNAKSALALMPIFDSFPTAQELAVAANLGIDSMSLAIEELENFSLVYRRFSADRDDDVFEILPLTKSFAKTKLRELGELDRQARRRLKSYFGASIPELLKAAQEMVSRGATTVARQFIDEEVLDRESNNAMAFYIKAQTYEKDLQYTSAIHEYQRAVDSAGEDKKVQIEAVLQLVALSKYEPTLTKESLGKLLTVAYEDSNDLRVALELARILRMTDKDSQAFQYYQKVFENLDKVSQIDAEEAAMFLFHHYKERRGPKQALEFLKRALKSFPECRTMLTWEKRLMEELGIISYKSEWKS